MSIKIYHVCKFLKRKQDERNALNYIYTLNYKYRNEITKEVCNSYMSLLANLEIEEKK